MNQAHSLNTVTYNVVSLAAPITVSLRDTQGQISLSDNAAIHFAVERAGHHAILYWPSVFGAISEPYLVMTAAEYLFTHLDGVSTLVLETTSSVAQTLVDAGHFPMREGKLTLTRQEFFQNPLLWHHKASYEMTPVTLMQTGTVTHPVRPSVTSGVLYRRYIPSIQKNLTFELLDLDRHLDTFHEWHNQRRVAQFWELNQSKPELREYLEKIHADPHHIPVIAALDGQPSGYFEMYWTPEDRLGPYYKCGDFDRGFHFLIGNKRHLGRPNFYAFIESLTHFLFLEEKRTQTLAAEPRADNSVLLQYLQTIPYWVKQYEFDFPHKRAALLTSDRDTFFREAKFS